MIMSTQVIQHLILTVGLN